MSETGLARARATMTEAGVPDAAIEVFSHYYGELEAGATGLMPEDSIEPLGEVPRAEDLRVDAEVAREAMSKLVVIKLNGGLGTSMGMAKAKSLLPVRGKRTFLDLVVAQVRAAREEFGVQLPLVFMNSFRTHQDTLEALAVYDDLPVGDLPLGFVQSQEPKLLTDSLEPAQWPADPGLEWCPPGHGDLYPSLLSSGVLDQLVDAGFRYASVSNSDNLGTLPSAQMAGWFATSGAPYAAEVCVRTPADRKGGHLAVRRSDGRIVLRETAQTSEEDMVHFTDETRHRYFHTNNLWFDLVALRDVLRERGGVLRLPLIRNTKTVDPSDPSSPEVYQIETAMGAAVEVFEGATAIEVPRGRFLPVKATDDLLLLSSDVYVEGADGSLSAQAEAPLVDLDPDHYKLIDRFAARFPHGAPSLKGATSFTVRGDWTFEDGVVVTGDAVVEPPAQGSGTIGSGTRLDG